MSNHVPTVRVVNQSEPDNYIVINYSDLRSHHELWPEQAEDFQRETSQPAKVATEYSNEELVASMRILSKLMAQKLMISVDQWNGMQPAQRIAEMQAGERQIDAYDITQRRLAQDPDANIQNAQQSGLKPPEPLAIGRGPGGKIYIMRGKDPFSGPYANRAEADAALKTEQEQH